MKNKNTKTILIVTLLAIAAVAIYLITNKGESSQSFTIEDTTPKFKKEGELFFLNHTEGDTLALIDIEVADNEQKNPPVSQEHLKRNHH